MWSSATFVSTTTGRRGRSSRRAGRRGPPRRPRRRRRRGELGERRRGQRLELRRAERLGRRPHARDRALEARRASVSSRSCQPATCGEVYAPTRSPSRAEQRRRRPRRRRLAVRADDVDRRVGALRVAELGEQRAHPVEPELRPGPGAEQRRDPVSPADGIELAPVALELLALRLDDLGGAFCDEALVREHPLGARDLLAQPLALGVDVAVRLRALGLHDRVEDPLLVALERDEHAAAAEDRRRLLHALERAGLAPRRRPRATARRSAASRAPGRFDQISSVTCGITGCSSFSSRSSAASGGRPRVGVAVVEARLDRLEVPVAEVVEGEVVELGDDVREVELGEVAARPSRCVCESRARIQRSSSVCGRSLRLGALAALQDQPADVPELVRELPPLLDRAVGEADVLRRGSSAARSASRRRRASSITSSGSMPVPRLFDIRPPVGREHASSG